MPDARPPHTFKVHGPTPPRVSDASEAPLYEISVAGSRALDRRAVQEYAIPSIVLMENAAIGLCTHAMAMLADARTRSALILAGPGNNGGDGFALARHLHNHRVAVTIVRSHDPEHSTGDARINLGIITKMRLPIVSARAFLATPTATPPALIIDALFGTGLTRAIRGPAADLIAWANRTRHANPATTRILAADIPSGLDADTGEPLGDPDHPVVITADRTVTFAALKAGMSTVEAQPYLGETHIAPIGAPIELLEQLATRITRPNDPTRRE